MIDRQASSEPSVLDNLNPVQRQAVTHGAGPLLILAGAGSGKTRVLTRRIAYLVRHKGISPGRILALTFTNKAAGEMRDRIGHLLRMPLGGLWIGTFHSICLRWLRRHPQEAGYRPGLTVFDTDDQRTLMRRLLREEGFAEEARRARDVLAIISRAKSRMQTPEAMRAAARTPARTLTARIYQAYQDHLLRQNAVDFDDLLLVAERLFGEQPAIAAEYAARFQHVLVDEFQDTNHVQLRLVERLSREHRQIFVVGDDDQSIYGWRGADVTNIIHFQKHFAEATVLRLEQNYRSSGAILAFANAVITKNESRWAKELWTERAAGLLPDLVIAGDEDEEASAVARRVVREVDAGERGYGDIAVFYRTHAQSRAIEDAFLRGAIPYKLVGGVYFYQRREVKDLLSYLRVLVNPLDEVNLRRSLAVPRRGIGETSVSRLLDAARSQSGDPLAVAAEGEIAGVRGRARKNLVTYGTTMLAWRERIAEPPELILTEILAAHDFKGFLEAQGGDWEERWANMGELVEGARLFSSAHGGGVAAYLDQVSLLTSVDELGDERDHVTLMTAHNAKGLEFPRVFVTGLEEGLFPHVSAFDDQEEMEEERRLFYVACTRAMDQLTLSASLLRRRINAAAGGVSRFLGEVDPALYDETELASPAWRIPDRAGRKPPPGEAGLGDRAGSYAARRRGEQAARGVGRDGEASGAGLGANDDLEHPLVGRRVFHATFGPGLVMAAQGSGDKTRVTVRFNNGSTRKVLRGYLDWEP
jgi:DNA helicase-2/ATP-dependent DNA helicase PcrA